MGLRSRLDPFPAVYKINLMYKQEKQPQAKSLNECVLATVCSALCVTYLNLLCDVSVTQ